MSKQFKLLIALSRAALPQTSRRSTVVANLTQAGAPQRNTRSKVLFESVKVACDRIESLDPLLCNAQSVVDPLDLRGVTEMRPVGDGGRSISLTAAGPVTMLFW